jgi:kumamolisin
MDRAFLLLYRQIYGLLTSGKSWAGEPLRAAAALLWVRFDSGGDSLMVEHGTELLQARNQHKPAGADDALINKLAQENLLSPQSGNKSLMSFEKAPASLASRYGIVTLHGIANIPSGVFKAVEYDVKHPLQTLETIGAAAGTAFVLKTVLPEGGLAGKVAGAAIGAYFSYKAAEPVIDAYKKAGQAQTMRDLDLAAVQIGDAGGSFIVNSAVAAVGYKVGSHYTERLLSSQMMDGYADAKANFYDRLGQVSTKVTDNLGLTAPAASELKAAQTPGIEPVKFVGSERHVPNAVFKGEVDSGTPMEVSVMLKSKGSDLRMNRTLSRIAEGRQAPLTDAQIGETFGARQESLDAVNKFAGENGLQIKDADLSSGRVVLKGTAAQFSEAFHTRLAEYQTASGETFRGRQGAISMPGQLNEHVAGVLGLDTRPQARSYATGFVRTGQTPVSNGTAGEQPPGRMQPRSGSAFMPNEVAEAYNFPKDNMGKGQTVAILELGGGIDMEDNAQYYRAHGLPEPSIKVIEVSGAKNKTGGSADSEVMLDSQVIGAVAPEATQNLIFAPNSDKGFVDAITRATFPEKGEAQPSAISISWGQNEEEWTAQGIEGMNAAFKKAALKGIAIFAASGDDGAIDNSPSRTKQADYPASDPHVTGSGGTTLETRGGRISSEVAWRSGGGGVSQKFGPQDFQSGVRVPANANTGQPGRGVPDVSGNANPATGYIIRVNGYEGSIGGTSAVSPLYSALMMRINGALGKPVPNLNAWLYKNPDIFNDIVSGNNGGYNTGPGYDAVTGLGSIDGTKMLEALKANPVIERSFGKFQFLGPAVISAATDRNR